MNIQFGEKLLHFSPTLAAQIGLDEAVLAQLVFELSHICPTKTLESVDCFYFFFQAEDGIRDTNS